MSTPDDTVVAERDEWRDAAKWADGQHQHWKTVAEAATAQRDEARRLHMVVRNELDTLRARLAACERVVEAAIMRVEVVSGPGDLCYRLVDGTLSVWVGNGLELADDDVARVAVAQDHTTWVMTTAVATAQRDA
jgi:hypothetical protein